MPQDPDPAEAAALRALLRGTSHVMVLVDADGTLRWASPSVQPVLGYDPAELVGVNVLSLLHPDDLELASELPLRGPPRSRWTGGSTATTPVPRWTSACATGTGTG